MEEMKLIDADSMRALFPAEPAAPAIETNDH
jgi:hypothetical protein